MILCVKQKPFSWVDRFEVYDENGETRYTVEGEELSWRKRLHVRDLYGREVIYIEQHLWTWLSKYDIHICGDYAASVVKQPTFGQYLFDIEGMGLSVRGDFLGHKYSVDRGDIQIAYLEKEWFTWGDCYKLYFDNPADEFIALAVILAIDCCLEKDG